MILDGCPVPGCSGALDVDLTITVRRRGREWQVSHADLAGGRVLCTEGADHALTLTEEQQSALVAGAEQALFAASGPDDL